MARNGSGTYVKVGSDFVYDTVISESAMNAMINDMVTALTQSVSKDGQTTLTGNINAGSNKLTALAVGTALTDSLTLGQAQNASHNYVASDTGSSNAYAIAPAPAVTSYVAGQVFHFKAANNSSGASTLAVSGMAAKAIQIAGSAVSGASVTTGGITSVIYDGTQFQLMSEDATTGGVPSSITVADESSDTTCFPLFATAATGNIGPKTGTNITFNSSTGELAATKMTPTNLGATTLTGAIAGGDQVVSAVTLKDYGETTQALGSAGGTRAVNLNNGNSVTATVSSSANTFTFSNPTASDELCGFTLELTNGGSQTVNWPASVDWAGASAPTLTTSGVDYLVFWTVNGGTKWYGGLVGNAFA